MPMMDPKDIREMRVDDMKKRCREAFLAFELKEGLIEQSDVGAIIRSLGINPSEEQVAGLLELVQAPGSADEETNVVRLDAFLEHVPRFLVEKDKTMIRDSYHKIYRAFAALDPQQNGYILPEDYAQSLRSEDGGPPMTDEEIEQALLSATDPNDGRINYAEYAYKLAYDGRKV